MEYSYNMHTVNTVVDVVVLVVIVCTCNTIH